VVHYDTTVDSVVSGSTVVDISGEGNNGTLVNGAAYSSTDRALTFDGSGDYVSGTLNNPAGAWVHTVSVWFKNNTALNADFQYLHFIGSQSANKASAIQFTTSSSTSVYVSFYGNYLYNSYSNLNLESIGQWRNITYSYTGGNTSTTNPQIYVDGKLTTGWTVAGGSAGTTLDLDANSSFRLATRVNNTQYFDGSISNFKLWNVTLTAEEVAAEYALGRTGKSINLTDTALCLGGTVPRAQLDVQGTARFNSVSNFHTGKLVGTGLAVLKPLEVGGYEEGLWTPYFSAVTVTMGNSYGKYVRFGSLVYVTFDMSYSSLNTTDTSGIHIDGLPFPQLEGGNHYDEPALLSIHETTSMFSLEPGGGRYSGSTLLISRADNSTYIKYNNCAASGRLVGCGQFMII